MPSTFQNNGKISTAATWNISVLKKDIEADVKPSFSAVKKEEPKIAWPENKNENEKIEKACMVRLNKLLSYPTNIKAKGLAKISALINITMANDSINKRLIFNRPLSSLWLFAP